MNRLVPLVLLSLGGICLQAQAQQSTITISTVPSGARFAVDGFIYSQAATFVWQAGSKHILVFVTDPVLPGQPVNTSIQTSPDGGTQYAFTGWTDNAGLLIPVGDPVQTITADPHVTSLKATLTVNYRVILDYFVSPDPTLPTSCGAPGGIPLGQFRPGVVFLGSQCFWASANVFVPANSPLTLNAFPYPGFVFIGWSTNLGTVSYLSSIVVKGPLTIAPQFSPAKRVHFLTSPLQLQVLIDHTAVHTRDNPDVTALCDAPQPVIPITGFPTLCTGDFDFGPGSTHTIAGISPQRDQFGKWWVFDSWSNGAGQNATYVTDGNTSTPDTLTAKFVMGAQVGFFTTPSGLKLSVDGRQNWPSYEFVWGVGTAHQVSAPANQFDAKGRQYTFQSWSNSGGAAQTVTVDQAAVTNGLRLTAAYGVLSRVVVQSSPSGLSVQVDGTTCQTPCTFDRDNGAQLRVTAPTTISLGDNARLDFTSWSDGAASDRTVTVNTDYQTITANYRPSYRLSAAADPANGVNFQFDPSSSDMFYPQDTQVMVTATPNPGFKFRRWDGDLTGTYPVGAVSMSVPHSVVARLDRVPYIAPAGVRNAAGNTPNSSVAPGSIISIFGESLAPSTDTGRVNPLSQTIDGVTVTVNDRILPLLFVSPQQINAQVPSDLPDGDYTLQVHATGQPDVTGAFTVARDAPGLFFQSMNSQQYAIALHDDGSPITPDNPARAGETISLLGTGFGPYNSIVIDGFFPPDPPPALVDTVGIVAGDQNPAPTWTGAAAGYTGVAVTKFKIPDGMPSGTAVPVSVNVNGVVSNTVMLPIQ